MEKIIHTVLVSYYKNYLIISNLWHWKFHIIVYFYKKIVSNQLLFDKHDTQILYETTLCKS